MLDPFFEQAGRSVSRQRDFRQLLACHVAVTGFTAVFSASVRSPTLFETLGYVLLVAGIVEGALVVGWRLTQLPKSQALELLLVSPLPPRA